MKTAELTYKEISEAKSVVTNIDDHDLSEDFFVRARGIRQFTPSKIAQRDWGTIHRYATAKYPISNISGNTAVRLIGGTSIYDSEETTSEKELDVIAGLDFNLGLHAYAYDPTNAAFTEVTRTFTATVGEIPAAGATDVLLATFQMDGSAYTPGNNELQGYAVIYDGGVKSAYIWQNIGLRIYLTAVIGSTGQNWSNGRPVKLYKGAGLINGAFGVGIVGNQPIVRWMETDAQRKVVMNYYNPVLNTKFIPLIFMRRPARKIGYYDATNAYEPIPVGWHVESGGGLCTFFKQYGDRVTVILDGAAHNTDSAYPADSWLRVSATLTGGVAQPQTNCYGFLYMTVVYDGYQESDPVFGFFCGAQPVSKIQVSFEVQVNPATMPKNVTGFRFYDYRNAFDTSQGIASTQIIASSLAAVTEADFLLARTVYTQQFNTATDVTLTQTQTEARGLTLKWTYLWDSAVARESNDSLNGSLQHAIRTNRAVFKPRYAARSTRQQGSIIAMDMDDNTIRMSSYDGSAVHEDDNFPDVSVDNNDFKQRLALTSHGELLGLGIQSDMLMAFKPTEIEFADFQSGLTNRTVSADVLAKNSIIQTPYGICWAGNSAIYWYPENGGGIQVLNGAWKNFWDGTLKAGNGTEFMNKTQRQGAISGYDPTYQCFWIHVNCATEDGASTENICWWFSFIQKGWFVRKLALGAESATFFTRRTDTMTIGYQSGLLKFPLSTGAARYKDGVLSDGTGGTAFEVKGVINMGSLYNLVKNQTPVEFLLDQGTSGTGAIDFRFYANHDASAFDTKTIPVTLYGVVPRQIQVRGMLERLRLEFELTGANLNSILDFELNTLSFGFLPHRRWGNQ